MTIGIATICDIENSPKMLCCADRLVTAGVKYEGLPKVQRISDSIGIMSSTNDADTSDAILKRAKTKFVNNTTETKVWDFVKTLKDECSSHKRDKIKQDVLENYQIVFDKFEKQPENMLKDAKDDVKHYKYALECEFLVFGMDLEDQSAHIIIVDQNGNHTEYDSSGFATIGEAKGLAFAEITKYSYNSTWPYNYAVPLIYRTKKICEERYESVGRRTDFGIYYFDKDETGKIKIDSMSLMAHNDIVKKLDNAISDIDSYERKILKKASEEILNILSPKEASKSDIKPEETS